MSCYECGPTNLTENVKWIHQKKKHEIPEIKENSSVHEDQVKEEDPVVVFEFKVKLDLEPKKQFFLSSIGNYFTDITLVCE